VVVGADAELGGHGSRFESGRTSRIYDRATVAVCRIFPPIAVRLFLKDVDAGSRLGCDGSPRRRSTRP